MPEQSEEIVQRLREEHRFRFGFHEDGGEAPSLYTDAADLIEAQHDENERLREVVRRIVDDETVVINEEGYLVVLMTDDPDHSSTIVDLAPEQFTAVKRAISGSPQEASDG